ncbi:DUF6454 family protein [Sphingomonas sp. QA11]|uniref:DUF6454 family protein n=1 Tax=Sphingomonas sp. QA11 TaxID=2950605 RepID=UPI00234920CF|nr:DUF6454 family protein [Sphingomonas sp. QA11]WCM28366.1 DUF6454 family protein [Sphingomonas sp. QA11]
MTRKKIRSALTALSLLLLSLTAAAAQEESSEAIQHARLVDILPLRGEVFHVQGVDLDSRRIWVTSVDLTGRKGYLHEFDRLSGRLLRRVELTDGPRYHPGGLSLADGSIWVAVAEMTPDSSAALVEIDTDSLRIRRRIPVADHLGCVAVSGRTLIAGNWDSRLLRIFDLPSGKEVRVVPNPFATRYQDMKFVGRQLVAGGPVTPFSGTIDWIDWPSMKLARTARTGVTDRARPYTGEGMALKGRDLFLVPEDGPSRLFHFRLRDREV